MKEHEHIVLKNLIFFNDTLKKDSPYVSDMPRNHHSLFLVTKGTLYNRSDLGEAIISEGEIGYIKKGACDESGAYLCPEVSYIATNFELTDADGREIELPFPTLCAADSEGALFKLFKDGYDAFLMKGDGYRIVANGCLMTAIGRIFEKAGAEPAVLKKRQRLAAAVEYMKENYGSADLRISDLCAIAFMSEKHFRRLFLEAYGKTPYDYLRHLRIARSRLLLSNTAKSVSDIALFCGFSDLYSFSHSFKKQIGISPKEYREKNQ